MSQTAGLDETTDCRVDLDASVAEPGPARLPCGGPTASTAER